MIYELIKKDSLAMDTFRKIRAKREQERRDKLDFRLTCLSVAIVICIIGILGIMSMISSGEFPIFSVILSTCTACFIPIVKLSQTKHQIFISKADIEHLNKVLIDKAEIIGKKVSFVNDQKTAFVVEDTMEMIALSDIDKKTKDKVMLEHFIRAASYYQYDNISNKFIKITKALY